GLHYAKFAPLIDAVEKYVADPNNGIDQVLLTGHSLAGSMVQLMMNEPIKNMEGFTWGSPGASISPGNQNIINFAHVNDPIPIIGSLDNHVAGDIIDIDGSSLTDPWFIDLISGLPQHKTNYVQDTSSLIQQLSLNDQFAQSSLGKLLSNT